MARTYITLFSCAGVGCYGFKMNNFECVASNEWLAERIAVQRANNKCKYDTGYVCGDATSPATHQRILNEIEMWRQQENLGQIDVVFATPPCQGMSTANYKKNDHEQVRNSLVVEAIELINEIHPKVFVFENVRAFMKSTCTDINGEDSLIRDSIFRNLSAEYNIYWKVINFKDYGVPSSRPRTIVIGTSRALEHTMPLNLFPTRKAEIPLHESIGGFRRLDYCQKDPIDPLHFARPFPEYMLEWIQDLGEGETAFDNPDERKPCTFDAQGNRVINKGAYMGNKYRRLIWNRPGACIATRSDVFSSQDTIHPCDNRVLSIRELMTLMTIPNTFQWTDHDANLTVENSDDYLRENEGNIRRCIGEAVPTHIGYTIAKKIKMMLEYEDYLNNENIVEYAENNVFIDTHDFRGFENSAQNVFDNINALKPWGEKDCLNVKVESLSDFIVYVPMLSSFYSHVQALDIIGVNFDDASKLQLEDLLPFFELGFNVRVKINPVFDIQPFFDIEIRYDGCVEFQRPKVKKVKRQKKTESKKRKAKQETISVIPVEIHEGIQTEDPNTVSVETNGVTPSETTTIEPNKKKTKKRKKKQLEDDPRQLTIF